MTIDSPCLCRRRRDRPSMCWSAVLVVGGPRLAPWVFPDKRIVASLLRSRATTQRRGGRWWQSRDRNHVTSRCSPVSHAVIDTRKEKIFFSKVRHERCIATWGLESRESLSALITKSASLTHIAPAYTKCHTFG